MQDVALQHHATAMHEVGKQANPDDAPVGILVDEPRLGAQASAPLGDAYKPVEPRVACREVRILRPQRVSRTKGEVDFERTW
jgi:hypothetical protein